MSARAFPEAMLSLDQESRDHATLARQIDRACYMCRGPGAGAEVTAGGVFSDLLRLAAYLGAPS
jgi:homoserine dehydrogenase